MFVRVVPTDLVNFKIELFIGDYLVSFVVDKADQVVLVPKSNSTSVTFPGHVYYFPFRSYTRYCFLKQCMHLCSKELSL